MNSIRGKTIIKPWPVVVAMLAGLPSWAVYGQAMQPVDGLLNVDNAVTIPPPKPVAKAQPLDAEPGPGLVGGQTAAVNSSAAKNAATVNDAPAEGSFELVNTSLVTNNAVRPGQQAAVTPRRPVAPALVENSQMKRIEKVEQGLNKLIRKQSFSKSIMGTIISAAASADPAIAVVGGVAGLLLGKAQDYKEAERRNNEIREQILNESPYYYTPDELRLAAYAGTQLDPLLMRPSDIELYADYRQEARTKTRVEGFTPLDRQMLAESDDQSEADEVVTPGAQTQLAKLSELADAIEALQVAQQNASYSSQFDRVIATAPGADPCARYSSNRRSSAGVTMQNASLNDGNQANHRRTLADRRALSKYCYYHLE